MNSIPKDPVLLYSYVNTMLRDYYSTLEDFCISENLPQEELEKTLAEAGFLYEKTVNQFR